MCALLTWVRILSLGEKYSRPGLQKQDSGYTIVLVRCLAQSGLARSNHYRPPNHNLTALPLF